MNQRLAFNYCDLYIISCSRILFKALSGFYCLIGQSAMTTDQDS